MSIYSEKLFTRVESQVSAVSLLESGEYRYIKAINKNNNMSDCSSSSPLVCVFYSFDLLSLYHSLDTVGQFAQLLA